MMLCSIIDEKVQIKPSSPSIVYIEFTKQCNLKCYHCFNDSGKKTSEIQFKDLKEVLEYTNKMNLRKLVFTGGEFFLYENAIEAIQLFRDYHLQILTNGQIGDENILKFIVGKDIELQITLCGSDSDIDRMIRPNAYEKTLDTIRKIVDIGGASQLRITYAIAKTNYYDIENTIKLCINQGIPHLQFSFIFPQGRAKENWHFLGLNQFQKYQIMNELVVYKEKYKNQIMISFSGLEYYLDSIKITELAKESGFCENLNEEIVIKCDGSIIQCHKIETYMNCLRLKNYKTMRNIREITYLPYLDINECQNCKNRKGCLKSCIV